LAAKHNSAYAMSRRRRTGLMVLGLLAAAVFIALDHTSVSYHRQRRHRSDRQIRAHDFQKYHAKTFKVINVVDGDTIDVDIPDGQDQHTRIRLWGVDTPETKSEEFGVMYFGPEAAEFTDRETLGKEVVVYLEETNRTRDKYDRLLAYVQLPEGDFLNEKLLSQGFAYADLRFDHSFYNKYQQLQASARSLKRGLWKKVSREQLPEWLQREKPNLLQSTK
jgi:micrococcal nuclease